MRKICGRGQKRGWILVGGRKVMSWFTFGSLGTQNPSCCPLVPDWIPREGQKCSETGVVVPLSPVSPPPFGCV